MANYFSSQFKLGILGGGQLGRMILRETQKLDIHTCVLDPSEEAPCKPFCNEFTQGDLLDFDAVYNFGKKVDLLTIEIEHIHIGALKKLESEGVKIFPQPSVLEIIQHKGHQKNFYKKHNIPTAPFKTFCGIDELKKEKHTYPFVWKSSQFGYDGMGVKVVKNEKDLLNLNDVACITESLVPIKKELAVLVAKNEKGALTTYPTVEMLFHPEANQVEFIICPSSISDTIDKKAQQVAIQVAQAFNITGLLAVELFLTEEDEIIVNEVAPRVHNSGHFTIEASYTSQFEQFLRSILNLPLGSTESKTPAVMANIVGNELHRGPVFYEHIEDVLQIEGASVHLYGKKETKPFRKMGHITVIDKNLEKALEKAALAKKSINVISKEEKS